MLSALVARMAAPPAWPLVGSGWRDITRVAAGDPVMWTAICQENRAAIRQQLGAFSDQLDRLRQILDDEDDDKNATTFILPDPYLSCGRWWRWWQRHLC